MEQYANGTNRLEGDFMEVAKKDLINEFRLAEIDCQRSEDRYAKLFDIAMQEIVRGAISEEQSTVTFGAGEFARKADSGLYLPKGGNRKMRRAKL